MGTRQYIGARYVPQFADPIAWSDQVSYEALTIVSYLNGMYTSKKAVPAGTLPTNTNYWVQTGNYNAQFEELERDIAAVKAVTNHGYKNIIVIGDSYGTNGEPTFPINLENFLGLPEGCFHARFVAGAGFANEMFYNQLHYFDDVITNGEDVTDIYFCGGWNDEANRHTHSEMLTQVAIIESYIATKYPNAIKHIVFISNSVAEFSSDLATTMGWYDDLAQRGWAVEPNMRYVMLNPNWVKPDGAHPNNDGAYALAYYMTQVIWNGEADVHYQFDINISDITPEDGIVLTTGEANALYCRIIVSIDNGSGTFKFYSRTNRFKVSFVDENDNPVSRSMYLRGTGFSLGTMTNKFIGNVSSSNPWAVSIPVTIQILESDGTVISAGAYLHVTNNVFTLELPFVPNSDGSDGISATVLAFFIPTCEGEFYSRFV